MNDYLAAGLRGHFDFYFGADFLAELTLDGFQVRVAEKVGLTDVGTDGAFRFTDADAAFEHTLKEVALTSHVAFLQERATGGLADLAVFDSVENIIWEVEQAEGVRDKRATLADALGHVVLTQTEVLHEGFVGQGFLDWIEV